MIEFRLCKITFTDLDILAFGIGNRRLAEIISLPYCIFPFGSVKVDEISFGIQDGNILKTAHCKITAHHATCIESDPAENRFMQIAVGKITMIKFNIHKLASRQIFGKTNVLKSAFEELLIISWYFTFFFFNLITKNILIYIQLVSKNMCKLKIVKALI